MQLHRSLVLLVAIFFAAAVIPVVVYRKIVFKPVFTAAEQAVATYSPSTVSIVTKNWQQRALTIPITVKSAFPAPSPAASGSRSAADSRSAPSLQAPIQPSPTVSFIMQDGAKGFAIIGGAILKEGDHYHEWRVVRIERNRVLLRGRKGTTWVTVQ